MTNNKQAQRFRRVHRQTRRICEKFPGTNYHAQFSFCLKADYAKCKANQSQVSKVIKSTTATHRQMIDAMLPNLFKFNQWEQSFLLSVDERDSWTPKQEAVIERMYEAA